MVVNSSFLFFSTFFSMEIEGERFGGGKSLSRSPFFCVFFFDTQVRHGNGDIGMDGGNGFLTFFLSCLAICRNSFRYIPLWCLEGGFFSFSVLVSPKMVCLLGGERESERKKKCRIGVR